MTTVAGLLGEAIGHQQRGEVLEAERAYRAALELDPGHADANLLLGVFLAQGGALEPARSYLERACSLAPESVDAHNAFANVASLTGQLETAATAYERALAIDPANPDVLGNLGRVKLDIGDTQGAIAALEAALTAAPEHPLANLTLAMAHERAGDLTAASTAYARTTRLAPDLVRDTVEAGHRNALERDPDDVDVLVRLAGLRLAADDAVQARELAQRAVELAPSSPDALLVLGRALLAGNATVESVAALERALAAAPRRVDTRLSLAEALERHGPDERALALLRETAAMHADFADAHFRLGLALVTREAHAPAAEAFRLALRCDPDHASAAHLLDAMTGSPSERPPDTFVEALFDEYAPHFDRHLVDDLGYRIPERIAAELRRWLGPSRQFESLLDIGCGTGLAGVACESLTRRLAGIDIAAKMIAAARAKAVYDVLEVAELDRFLATTQTRFDAVVAADVVIYVGALERLFAGLARCVRPGTCFALSIEREDDAEFRLRPSARYSHSLGYLNRLGETFGWRRVATVPTTIRRHGQGGIDGYVVLLESTPSSD